MSPENFCYWLQGCFEIQNPQTISKKQAQIIKDHLELVFKKETPNRNLLTDNIFVSYLSNVSC